MILWHCSLAVSKAQERHNILESKCFLSSEYLNSLKKKSKIKIK